MGKLKFTDVCFVNNIWISKRTALNFFVLILFCSWCDVSPLNNPQSTVREDIGVRTSDWTRNKYGSLITWWLELSALLSDLCLNIATLLN